MFEDLVLNIRRLAADDLNIGFKASAASSRASSAPHDPSPTDNDPLVQEISRLASEYGGVILAGPPGTSKSFYAAAAGLSIAANDKSRYRFVQFHASYQYEDFMTGYAPTATGFTAKVGPFLQLANAAAKDAGRKYVLVVDELSRADVGRVFGEALTYIERSKREKPFTIASGEEITVPGNLVIIATMNPFDRGVDEVDAAFERRFAKIPMEPDPERLRAILEGNEMDDTLMGRVLAWFNFMNNLARQNPSAAVGHAYFSSASDQESLADIWRYQLQYLVQRAFRRDETTRADVERNWRRLFRELTHDVASDDDEPSP